MQKKYISCTFFLPRTHLSEICSQSRRGGPKGGTRGSLSPPVSLRSAHVSACDGFCIIRSAVACCMRLWLSLLCVSLRTGLCSLRLPAALTLSACHCRTYLPRRLPSLMLGACSCRLSVRHFLCLCVGHYSGSSGVERAEFTPYPSETIEKPIRSEW